MANLIDLISLNKTEKKAFLCIFLISLVSLLSLLRANILHIDDIGRVTLGSTWWEQDGRPFASFLSVAIQLGKPLTNISPLPQIICLALYSLSSIYLGKVFGANNGLFLILGGLIFVLNPFNLQSFCYIFDSLTMGLAVLGATTSFFLLNISLENPLLNRQKFLLFSLVIFLLFSTLCLYQSATSIFLCSIVFLLLIKISRDNKIKQPLQQLLLSLSLLLFALLIYTPVKNFYIGKNRFIVERMQIPHLTEIPGVFSENLLASIKYIRESLGRGKPLSFLIFLLLIFLAIYLTLLICKQFRKKRISILNILRLCSTVLLAFFGCFLLIVSFYGLPLIFRNPVYSPRQFMGFSAFIGISCFFLTKTIYSSVSLRRILIFFLCLLCLSFMNVSLTLGNTLYTQNNYEERIATILLSDLESEISNLPIPILKPRFALSGPLNYGISTYPALRKYPIVKEIVQPYFSDKLWGFGNRKLQSLGFKFDFDVVPDGKNFIPNSKPIINRRFYNIYLKNNDTFFVVFKK